MIQYAASDCIANILLNSDNSIVNILLNSDNLIGNYSGNWEKFLESERSTVALALFQNLFITIVSEKKEETVKGDLIVHWLGSACNRMFPLFSVPTNPGPTEWDIICIEDEPMSISDTIDEESDISDDDSNTSDEGSNFSDERSVGDDAAENDLAIENPVEDDEIQNFQSMLDTIRKGFGDDEGVGSNPLSITSFCNKFFVML